MVWTVRTVELAEVHESITAGVTWFMVVESGCVNKKQETGS